MTTSWILVANASTARIYSNNGPKKGLKLVKELNHPESRQKSSDLVSDRPGYMQGFGNGHGSRQPATTPKEIEVDKFALEIAKELDHGRTTNDFERLIVVASNPFIGTLNGHLSNHVRGMVSDSMEKDYTKSTQKELAGYLEPCIYL
jgi:protein required for attachment to host cells